MREIKILFIGIVLFISYFASSQCITGTQSKMTTNSKTIINSTFNFDYKIKSILKFKTKSVVRTINMTYFVNTKDGSMFFPKEIKWSNDMRSINNDNFRYDGAIWMSNRQMVMYGLDKQFHKKRAMTIHSKKTADDFFIGQHLSILSFFNDINNPEKTPEIPDPLPSSFFWVGITQGYKGEIVNANTSAMMTLYLDKHSTNIKTSVPLTGFLVGVINFMDNDKCNKLAVYTKIDMENGDYIEETLISMTKENHTFNARAYESLGLLKQITNGSGTTVQNMQVKMMKFQQKIMLITQQIEHLKIKKEQCDDISCKNQYKKLLKNKKKEAKKIQCQMAEAMGVGDMTEGCN